MENKVHQKKHEMFTLSHESSPLKNKKQNIRGTIIEAMKV